ncbi:MAG: hypothetical protein KY452_01510 [Actinobacteria bacterium]|nr:hypothetical protein [Actinomycetota bacterium]
MPELENELRTRLRQDAERVRPDVDAAWSDVSRRLGAAPPARSRTPAWQRPWLTASVAAALLAVFAAVVLVPGDGPTTVAVGPESDSADEAGDAPDQAARMSADSPEAATPRPTTTSAQQDGEAPPERSSYVGPFEGMFPAVTWETYDRLRHEMATGSRAWTADPEQVATRFLQEVIGAEPDGQLRPIGDQVAEYEWSGGRLVLRRYGPPGDPWVVTAADAAGVQVGIGGYRGMELSVAVRLERAGTVTVRTGAFDSEWVAAHTDEVPAGGTTEARLQVGREDAPGPDALLVEVRVDFADGSTAHARYRADAIGPPSGD